jgi:ankyrin repeat protein
MMKQPCSLVVLLPSAAAQASSTRHALTGTHAGDDEGSLLGAASFKGHVAVVELLLDHAADVNGRGENGKLPTFLTPLMHAAYNGRTSVVAMLLERKAQPNIGHDRQTQCALACARRSS